MFVINNVNSTDGFVIGPSISEYFITYFWFIIILTILILSNLREVYSNKLLQALLAYILYQFLISRVSNQYFPMQIQSYVGLAFSYTLAIVILIDKISFNYRVIALIVLTLIISTCSNIVFYKNLIYSIKNKTYPIFQSQSELDSFEFISRNIPKKAKIGVCQSRARSLSYYTENFVTYDVVIDSSKGENQFFWELLQNQTINKSEFSKHIQESGLNYFYLYQSDSSCAVSLMTYEYFVDSTNLLYQDGSISIFQIK